MKANGDLVTTLWEMRTDLITYCRDILEETGLEVPATFDEWLAAAEAVRALNCPVTLRFGCGLCSSSVADNRPKPLSTPSSSGRKLDTCRARSSRRAPSLVGWRPLACRHRHVTRIKSRRSVRIAGCDTPTRTCGELSRYRACQDMQQQNLLRGGKYTQAPSN